MTPNLREIIGLPHLGDKSPKCVVNHLRTLNMAVNNRLKMKTFYAWEGDVLILNLLGTPNAKKDKLGKPRGNQLKISVAAAPRAGKATDHMVKFLAEEFGVKTADIEVVSGRMNINKQIRVTAPKNLPPVIAR